MSHWLGLQQAYHTNASNETLTKASIKTGASTTKSASILIGYEQGTDKPLTLDRVKAAEVFPQHAEYLHGDDNPYKLPGIPDTIDTEEDLTGGNGYELVDPIPSVDQPNPSLRSRMPPTTINANAPPTQSTIDLAYVDIETLARLEGRDLFSGDRFEDIASDKALSCAPPSSQFSDNSNPTQNPKAGLFRSMSKKINGALRKPSVQPGSTKPHGEAQQNLSSPVVAGPSTATSKDELLYPNVFKPSLPKKSKSAKKSSSRKQQLASQPPQPVKQLRPVKVIGDPDRSTVFGDFIDYQSVHSSSDGIEDRSILLLKSDGNLRFSDIQPDSEGEGSDNESTLLFTRDGDLRFSDIKPPSPLQVRKSTATKTVKDSGQGTRGPDSPTLPALANVRHLHDLGLYEAHTRSSLDDIIQDIDEQIAESSEQAANRARTRLWATLHPWEEEAPERDADVARQYGDEEWEVVADMFVDRGEGTTTWVVTERPERDGVMLRRWSEEGGDSRGM